MLFDGHKIQSKLIHDPMKYQIALLFILCMVCLSLPNVRTGIVQALLNSDTRGTFNVNFATPIPDSSYNLMTTVAYLPTFDNSKGVNFNANCNFGKRSLTGLRCLVTNSINSTVNIAYFNYVVSSQSDFLCSIYTQFFTFSGNSLSTNITFDPPFKEGSFASERNSMINSRAYIAGLDSEDGDFSLVLGQNTLYLSDDRKMQIQVIITEFDFTNLTVTFGYMILDSEGSVNIRFFTTDSSVLSQMNLTTPNNNLILYGVGQINSKQKVLSRNVPAKPLGRRLQVVPLDKTTVPSDPNSGSTDMIIYSLKNNLLQENNIQVKLTPVEPQTFKQWRADGIIDDVTFTQYNLAYNKAVAQAPPNLFNRVYLVGNKMVVHREDYYVFNRLFATNGFLILANASSIDQVYYFELAQIHIEKLSIDDLGSSSNNLLSDTTSSTPSTSTQIPSPSKYVFTKSIVSSKIEEVPPCDDGALFKVLNKIDYIQQGYLYKCIKCNQGQFLNYDKKRCELIMSDPPAP